MRRIVSAEQERKKQKRNQVIVSLVLVVIMLLSTIGYASREDTSISKKLTYKGFEFVYSNNYWTLEKEGVTFFFKSKPNELEEIEGYVKPLNNYLSEPLYLSSKEIESNSEIYLNLGDLVTRIQFACLENQQCEGNFPVKDCTSNFIILEESNETSIIQENNCVYIRGEKQNLIKLTDTFLLKILGIE